MNADHHINIFEYTSYRKYLNDFYTIRKAENSKFSHRQFAMRAGLSSPSHLLMIIKGERNLSLKSMNQFAAGLSLNKRESQYFEFLVRYEQSSDLEERSLYFAEMMQLRSKLAKLHSLERERFEFLSRWYSVAIYTLIDLKDFKSDLPWICNRLHGRITEVQAKETLENLRRLGLIAPDHERGYRQIPGAITVADDTKSIAVFNYHKAMIQLAAESLRQTPLNQREMNGVTLSIPKSKLPELKEKIRAFRKEINSLVSSYMEPDEVYQLNLQLFPLTKLEEKK